MKYRDVIGFSKKKQKFVKKAIIPTPPKPSIAKKLKEELLKEEIIEVERIHDMESQIFDVIITFKKTFEKSEWKKNRKINSFIKKMIDLEAKLGNETLELE